MLINSELVETETKFSAMPHEIKDAAERKLGFRGYPKVLLDRPSLAALIGAIAGNWGEIDETLKHVFNAACAGEPDGFVIRLDPTSNYIYKAVEQLGLRTRIDLVRAVLRPRLGPDIAAEFDEIAKEVRKRSPERNDVVHAQWQICDEYPDDLILLKDGIPFRYTYADLTDRLDRAVSTRNRLWDFSIKVGLSPRLTEEG